MELMPVMMQQTVPDQQLPVPDAVSGQGAQGMFALFLGNLLAGAEVRTLSKEGLSFPLDDQSLPQTETEKTDGSQADPSAALQAMVFLQQVQQVQNPSVPQEGAEAHEDDGAMSASAAILGAGESPVQVDGKEPAMQVIHDSPVSATGAALPQPAVEKTTPAASALPEGAKVQVSGAREEKPVKGEVKLSTDPAVSVEMADGTSEAAASRSTDAHHPDAGDTPQEETAPSPQKLNGKAKAPMNMHEQKTVAPLQEQPAEEGAGPVKLATREAPGNPAASKVKGEDIELTATEKPTVSPSPVAAAETVKVATETRHQNGVGSAEPTEKTAPVTHDQIMAQVKEKLVVHEVAPGRSEVALTLHPEELGELKIMLHLNDQQLKVEVIAQNLTVKEALMQNLEGLRESLSRQNITVDRFDVSTGGGTFNEAFSQGRRAAQNRPIQAYPSYAPRVAEPEGKQVRYASAQEHSLVDVRF